MAGLPWELLYPRRIAVYLTGKLERLDGAQGRHPLRRRPAHRVRRHQRDRRVHRPRRAHDQRHRQGDDHATWARSSAPRRRCSPTTSTWRRTCSATGRGELVPLAEQHQHLLAPDAEVEARSREVLRRACVELDLSTLEPHVVGPHSPDRARPISQARRRGRRPEATASSTTISSGAHRQLHQLVLRGHEPRRRRRRAGERARRSRRPRRFMVTPGSEQVRATIERDGQMAVAARTSAAPCSPTPAARASASGAAPRTRRTSRTRSSPPTTATSPARNDGAARRR